MRIQLKQKEKYEDTNEFAQEREEAFHRRVGPYITYIITEDKEKH